MEEAQRNLPHLPPAASDDWKVLQGAVTVVPGVFTVDRPVVFEPGKDRPILFGALAWADVLVTLDQADFGA